MTTRISAAAASLHDRHVTVAAASQNGGADEIRAECEVLA
jgi:hypothetical protein